MYIIINNIYNYFILLEKNKKYFSFIDYFYF